MYDLLSSRVVSEMFGAEDEDGPFNTQYGSMYGDVATGLTSKCFSRFTKRLKKKATASFAGVDPRVIDARRNEGRTCRHTGFGALIERSDLFGDDDENYGFDRLDLFGS